jgi:hypothetical protein|tara:strand:- start:560 stop:811 length:252 start_codon:yes stop_codon:yes gene_type:complete
MKVVEIKWGDAWIDTDDFSVTEAKKLKPVVRSTIGYLVSENSKAVVLCTDVFEKDKKTINTPMIIPTEMIIDYWEYEIIPKGE